MLVVVILQIAKIRDQHVLIHKRTDEDYVLYIHNGV
jgi:hypothetical protein